MRGTTHASVQPGAHPLPRKAVALGLLAILALGCDREPVAELSAERNAEGWSVYALRYARSQGVPRNLLMAAGGAGEAGAVDMSWHFYALAGHGRLALVDAGSDRLTHRGGARAKRWHIAWARTVAATLAEVGVRPGDVTDVLLTHRHWDHSDGIAELARARVHAHAGEWRAIEAANPQAAGAIEREGRATTFDAERARPLPGIEARVLGQHTRYHTVYVVDCRGGGRLALAGDGAYLYENLERHLPIAQTSAPERNVAEMQSLVDEIGAGRVIPGHDPALFRRAAALAEDVARLCP